MKKLLAAPLLLALAANANAGLITYNGELTDGVMEFGATAAPFDTHSDWWFFEADAGDVITLTLNRLEEELDPAMSLYFGLHTDTASLPSNIAIGDDELAQLPGLSGPFGDPQIADFVIDTSGFYSVAAWSYASLSPSPYDYQILLTVDGAGPVSGSVPVPGTLALIGIGLLGMAAFRRRSVNAA